MQTRRTLIAAAGVLAAATQGREAAAADDGRIVLKPAQPPVAAGSDHFTGAAAVSAAFSAQAPARASGGTVNFAPSARTDWHTHPLGQTLVVLSGTGLVQRWGSPVDFR